MRTLAEHLVQRRDIAPSGLNNTLHRCRVDREGLLHVRYQLVFGLLQGWEYVVHVWPPADEVERDAVCLDLPLCEPCR